MIFSTVDVVTFALINEDIHVLLHKRPHGPFEGAWALPGVEVRPEIDGSVEDAARRAIKEKGGVTPAYIEQLGVFSGAGRDPRGWSQSCAFIALLHEDSDLSNHDTKKWFLVSSLEKSALPFDHFEIIQSARARLQSKTSYSTVAAFLATKTFTLPRLQKIFELCKGGSIDKVTFRRRMENCVAIEKAPGQFDHSSKRPAQLYRISESIKMGKGGSVFFFDREI